MSWKDMRCPPNGPWTMSEHQDNFLCSGTVFAELPAQREAGGTPGFALTAQSEELGDRQT